MVMTRAFLLPRIMAHTHGNRKTAPIAVDENQPARAGQAQAAGPPQVQGGDVPLDDGVLPPGLDGDGLDGAVVFDQAEGAADRRHSSLETTPKLTSPEPLVSAEPAPPGSAPVY